MAANVSCANALGATPSTVSTRTQRRQLSRKLAVSLRKGETVCIVRSDAAKIAGASAGAILLSLNGAQVRIERVVSLYGRAV